MALLNSDAYGDLAKVSASTSIRKPGKFFSMFITGEPRPEQEMGKLQCMTKIEGGKYLIHNSSSIYFIPYFIKRVWEKYATVPGKTGEYDKLVAFGWDDDVPKIDDSCKFSYIVAGLLLNSETKKAVVHSEDIEDAEIKAGDPVLVFHKCAGMKFDGAMKLIDAIANKAKDLPPLSNNPEFEKKVVAPRRFICTTTVGIAPSKHGNKNVFQFEIGQVLPDKAVEQVMNSAMELMPEFERQFDKTASASPAGSGSTGSAEVPTFEEAPAPTPESQPSTEVGENFDLGI